MPLPCPLFDYWHRHATMILIAATICSVIITWGLITSNKQPPKCAPNKIMQPQHQTHVITAYHCRPKQWMQVAGQLGLIDMNYQGQDKPLLELLGSFQHCMDLIGWLDQHHAPLQRISLKRATLRSEQHRRIITCHLTFHCP